MRSTEESRRQAEVWLSEQARLSLASVVRNTPRGNAVHVVTIEGQRFSAGVCHNSILVGTGGGWSCALGVASINDESLDGDGWAICKYWNQRHVDLQLSEAGLRALALEFGLPIVSEIGYPKMRELCEADFFYMSSVFQSLIAWAAAHPRKIRALFGDSYLGLWPLAAMKGHRVEATEENLELARSGYRGLQLGKPHESADPAHTAVPQ